MVVVSSRVESNKRAGGVRGRAVRSFVNSPGSHAAPFPRDFQKCSDFDSDDTSVWEIPKSEANYPQMKKLFFSKSRKLTG